MDMEMEEIGTLFFSLCTMFKIIREVQKERTRRWAVRPINVDWGIGGYHLKTFRKIKSLDEEQFFKHTRMPKNMYELLMALLGDVLHKPRQRIKKDERLSITLLYLAHGQSMQSIAWSHKLGKSTVRKIILETCEALWDVLQPLYLSEPTTSQYLDIANGFERQWNFPNCVGAIDGKHIAIKCPKKSGTLYFNYKKNFSVVLMAACDANYTFTAVSAGSYGGENDAGVFRMSSFGNALLEGRLPIPAKKPLTNTNELFPHVFVADAAFPLGINIMKPVAPPRNGGMLKPEEDNFNYRLSRARRTIENAFGILSARRRVLLTTLELMPENVDKIVLACVALHNFLMLNDTKRWYCPHNFVDADSAEQSSPGLWREEVKDCGQLRDFVSHSRRSTADAIKQRERLIKYFVREGSVPFQPYENRSG